MSILTDDEFTVLMIATNGEYMAPIGRWKPAILNLAERGLMQRLNDVNYTITEAGRKACEERDHEDDAALGRLLESGSKVAAARTTSQQHVEQAALHLSMAAKASSLATGDTFEAAVENWSYVAKARALELLKDG